MTLRVDD